MEPKDLIAIYDNRWKQIQHLNELDLRSLVLVVTALTGAVVSAKASPQFPVLLETGVASLAIIVCAGGIYSVVHNRISMEHALAAIDFIENQLNGQSQGLFQFAGKYQPPSTRWNFIGRITRSIRGPILLFFAVALIASLTAFAHGTFRVFGKPPYERILSLGAGIVLAVPIVWFSLCSGWRALKAFVPPKTKPTDA